MPWESEKQRAWGHTPAGTRALGGKKKVKEWDRKTGKKKLPKRKSRKK